LVGWVQESAPCGIVITDTHLRICKWNRWLENASGRKQCDLAGKDLLVEFPELVESGLHEKYQKALQGESFLLSTAFHSSLFAFPASVRDQDGGRMRQTATIAPLLLGDTVCGTITMVEDVTQRECQAAELRRQYRRQQFISSAAEKLLMARNPREVIGEFSPTMGDYLKLDGFALFQTQRDGTWTLLTSGGRSSDVRGALTEQIPAWLSHETCDPEAEAAYARLVSAPDLAESTRDSTSAYVLCRKLSVEDNVLGAFILVADRRGSGFTPDDQNFVQSVCRYLAAALDRDVRTERLTQVHHNLENEVQERTARLQDTVQQLESFSYSVAHDLRAPIRAIKGFGEVLLEDFSSELSSEARMFIARIRIAAVKMELLTKDLLNFCQISREEVIGARIDVEDMVREISFLLPALQGPGVLTVELPLQEVFGHRTMLRQALMNLLSNAVKFGPRDGDLRVVVRTELRTVSGHQEDATPPPFQPVRLGATTDRPDWVLDASEAKTFVRIWIEDNGIGIAPRNHQKVFGIFERLHGDHQYEGTGIGLAIVAKAVQRMGGSCGVESEQDKGSRFWIELPTPP